MEHTFNDTRHHQSLFIRGALILLLVLTTVTPSWGMGPHKSDDDHAEKELSLINLTNNSVNALKLAMQTSDLFNQELATMNLENKDAHESSNLYNALVGTYEKKCPWFRTSECTKLQEESCVSGCIETTVKPCPLSRLHNHKARALFTKKVVQKILIAAKRQQGRPVIYTSFASGGLFTDLVILDSAFSQQPNLNIVVHFIDGNYLGYTTGKKHIGKADAPVGLNDAEMIFSTEQKAHFVAEVRAAEEPECKNISDEAVFKRLQTSIHEEQTRSQQLMRYLINKYPRASLTQYVYDFGFDYLERRAVHGNDHADVVVTADIDDQLSKQRGAFETYVSICTKSLRHNQHSTNLMLGFNKKFVLREIRLKTKSRDTSQSNAYITKEGT